MHSRHVVFDAGAYADSSSVRHEQTDAVGQSQDHQTVERYDLRQTVFNVVDDHHDLDQLGLIGVRVTPIELLFAVLEGKRVRPCQLEDYPFVLARPQE